MALRHQASLRQTRLLPQFGIKSARIWKMKRVWVGQGEEEESVGDATEVDGVGTVVGSANVDKRIGKRVRKELFECYISFSVSYNSVQKGRLWERINMSVHVLESNERYYRKGDWAGPGKGGGGGNEERVGMGMRKLGQLDSGISHVSGCTRSCNLQASYKGSLCFDQYWHVILQITHLMAANSL